MEYVKAEITKAKLPEASGKVLTESLIRQVVLTEDGEIDSPKFAQIVSEAIKAKTEEIAAVLKERAPGIRDNGGAAPPAGAHDQLVESFTTAYLKQGLSPEVAKRRAEAAAGGRS